MVKFLYRKGVYMLVSAISSSSLNIVSNKRVNSRGGDSYTEIASNNLKSFSSKNVAENKNSIFDSINEWKYFCHEQIEKGNFDIIV